MFDQQEVRARRSLAFAQIVQEPVLFSAGLDLGQKLPGKKAQCIQLRDIRKAEGQFLNTGFLKRRQTLADRPWVANQRAVGQRADSGPRVQQGS